MRKTASTLSQSRRRDSVCAARDSEVIAAQEAGKKPSDLSGVIAPVIAGCSLTCLDAHGKEFTRGINYNASVSCLELEAAAAVTLLNFFTSSSSFAT